MDTPKRKKPSLTTTERGGRLVVSSLSPNNLDSPKSKLRRCKPNTACAECRKCHFKCDGQTPCQQCKRKNARCYFPISSIDKIKILEEHVVKLTATIEAQHNERQICEDKLQQLSSDWDEEFQTFLNPYPQWYEDMVYTSMQAFRTLGAKVCEFIIGGSGVTVNKDQNLIQEIFKLEKDVVGDPKYGEVPFLLKSLILYLLLTKSFFNARISKWAKFYSEKLFQVMLDHISFLSLIQTDLLVECIQSVSKVKLVEEQEIDYKEYLINFEPTLNDNEDEIEEDGVTAENLIANILRRKRRQANNKSEFDMNDEDEEDEMQESGKSKRVQKNKKKKVKKRKRNQNSEEQQQGKKQQPVEQQQGQHERLHESNKFQQDSDDEVNEENGRFPRKERKLIHSNSSNNVFHPNFVPNDRRLLLSRGSSTTSVNPLSLSSPIPYTPHISYPHLPVHPSNPSNLSGNVPGIQTGPKIPSPSGMYSDLEILNYNHRPQPIVSPLIQQQQQMYQPHPVYLQSYVSPFSPHPSNPQHFSTHEYSPHQQQQQPQHQRLSGFEFIDTNNVNHIGLPQHTQHIQNNLSLQQNHTRQNHVLFDNCMSLPNPLHYPTTSREVSNNNNHYLLRPHMSLHQSLSNVRTGLPNNTRNNFDYRDNSVHVKNSDARPEFTTKDNSRRLFDNFIIEEPHKYVSNARMGNTPVISAPREVKPFAISTILSSETD